MESAIVIAALTKSFGRETALRDVSLCIAPGSVFALVGANGAGKTTLLKILMNILAPTSGHANILGLATAAGAQDYDPYPNLCWSYDDFGNRTAQTASATAYTSSNGGTNSCPVGSGPSYLATYNADNQLSGGLYGYDAAGDVTADSTTGNSYLYDGEGRICAMQQSVDGLSLMTQYIYDADGVRVAKGTISAFSCNTATNGFVATTVYVLGPGGEQMTEMTSVSGTWQLAHTNVDAGALSATYDADLSGQTEGKMYFHLSDWLGTRRQQTDYAGNPMLNFTGLPYGDGLATIPVSTADVADATEHHFTGKERDAESGNDYFGARYYASSMGRMLSPDPGNIGVDRANPQSWNMYSYSLNNPLAFTDPTGMYVCEDSTNCDSKNDQNFAKALAAAQTAVNNMAAGADRDSAQRAIDAYGAQGVDNGVNVRFDANISEPGGVTEVSGIANGNKSADNPTGQNINVTFKPDAMNTDWSGGLAAHEGSHVADASAWVGSGFSASMNPTSNATELRAYQVQFNVMNGIGNNLYGPNGTFRANMQYGNARVDWKKGDSFKLPEFQVLIKTENGKRDSKPAFTAGKGAAIQP